jgi:hypothetical protein
MRLANFACARMRILSAGGRVVAVEVDGSCRQANQAVEVGESDRPPEAEMAGCGFASDRPTSYEFIRFTPLLYFKYRSRSSRPNFVGS